MRKTDLLGMLLSRLNPGEAPLLETAPPTAEADGDTDDALKAELAAKTAEVETLKAELDAAKTALQAHEKRAKDAQMQERESALKALLGDAPGEQAFATSKGLSQEAFNALIGALQAARGSEQSSPAFTETGIGAEATPDVIENGTTRLLREKYQTNPTQK